MLLLMKRRYFLVSTLCFVALSGALPAHAETLPAGVFRMADGMYFHPASRTRAPSLEALVSSVPGTAPIATSTPATATSTAPVLFPLKAAIERARAELQSRIAAAPATPQFAAEEAETRDVTLAIWNSKMDVLRYVEARKRGTSLTRTDGADDVQVVRTNGINSTYRVLGEDGEVVVGVRYPIYKSVGTAAAPKYEVREVTYVPYSAAINTPEMAAYGERWLKEQINDAYGILRDSGVASLAFDGALLADTVDKELVTAILAIEHLDTTAVQKYPRESLAAFYVVLAANESSSYNYSRSSANAFGLAQFIPSTYKFVAGKSELKLNPDFEAGLSDPNNAIRAQVAYLDYIHSRLPSTTVANYSTQRDLVHEYLAASYNGGYPIVAKAMRVWAENLDAKERYIVRTRSRLKLETMNYVLKLRNIREAIRERATAVVAATQ